ncbi:portal protein [Cellulophaga phage phi47:1]|nr:portal protein [Cellulophaga phage phi47:1]
MQVIDGEHIEDPFDDTGKAQGNNIVKGIEINSKGEYVAFWVSNKSESSNELLNGMIGHTRIEAVNSNGNLVAWMMYGDKARIDHHRGIPVITSILEKVSLLDRFTIASVVKAEQTANVVFGFEHSTNSTGENILKSSLTSKKNPTTADNGIPNELPAKQLRQAVQGTVLNLTPDSKLVSLSSENETSFNEFFRAIFVTLCAAVEIPEEVALQKYEQNYSSSRAAINGWEFIVEIYRQRASNKSYQPFYRYWLEIQILKGVIQSNGFLISKSKKNFMAMEAYFNARFLGRKMPHIDPLKEAKGVRALLGDDKTPLVSYEQATELMGHGDWRENYKKYLEEDKEIPEDKKPVINEKNSDNKQE